MSKDVSETTGDGINTQFRSYTLSLPDAGGSIIIEGNVADIGMPQVAITGSPLTGPAVPGAGSTYWIIQVNTTTGAATIKTSFSATPAPDAGNILIFSDVVASTDATIAVSGADQMPDS